MKDIALSIISRLVDKPEELKIEETKGNNGIRLEITPANDDLGKVLGKHGKNINSIRTILKAICSKENKSSLTIDVIQ